MHELPLVIFTVLAQAVAGSFILLQLIRLLPAKCAISIERSQLIKILVVLLGLLGLSGAAALTHLGSPLRAPNVLFGLAHLSAMSLEIVTVSAFGALATGVLFFAWPNITGMANKLVNIAATIVAFLQLIAIANVYHLDTVYFWDTGWTWVNFILSGFTTGSLLVALLIKITATQPCHWLLFKRLWGAVVIVSTALSGAYLLHLAGQLSTQDLLLPTWIEVLLIARIGLIIGAFTLCISLAATQLKTVSLVLATCLVIGAELLGRITFYELSLLNHL